MENINQDSKENADTFVFSKTILDPLNTLTKLALLNFYSDDNKLVFCYNTFYMQGSSYYELILRQYYYKANRNDLIQLYLPLRLLSFYYSKEKQHTNRYINNLMLYAIKGLSKLQKTYKSDHMIVLLLQHYIDLLNDSILNVSKEYKFLDDLLSNPIKSEMCKKELWDDTSIKVISDKFDLLNIKDQNSKDFISIKDDIESYIKMKEERYQKYFN